MDGAQLLTGLGTGSARPAATESGLACSTGAHPNAPAKVSEGGSWGKPKVSPRALSPVPKGRTPAAAPGALPGQAGRRVGDSEIRGSAAQPRFSASCRPRRSPCTSTWRPAGVQGALTIRRYGRCVKYLSQVIRIAHS